MEPLRIWTAERSDVPLIKALIEEMAEHANLPVARTEAQLAADGFGQLPAFQVFLAEWNRETAGYALFYECYSSFRGRGLFLEDVYVKEPFRGRGIANALVSRVAQIAIERSCFGIEFNVLAWNEAAMRFFTKAGAVELEGRKTLCISQSVLRASSPAAN